MNCPRCKKEAPPGREMCPACGAPIKPLPVPPGGKIRFGGYDWFVLDRQDGRALLLTEKVIEKRAYHGRECEVAVDGEGIVRHWRLRSPGANRRFTAVVMGFCGDEYDHGGIGLDGGGELKDGRFVYDGSGYLSGCLPEGRDPNGVRPALWLRMP